MGEARRKKEKPTVRRGPHGHNYYCRNGCGSVAYTKTTNQIFTERKLPLFGWCSTCKQEAAARAEEERRLAIAAATAQQQAEHLSANVGGDLAAAARARAAALQAQIASATNNATEAPGHD